MIGFLIRMLELFGVVFLRFRPIPRLWCVWLVGVNLTCVYFITHIEAQVLLAVTMIAVVGQTLIYQRIGLRASSAQPISCGCRCSRGWRRGPTPSCTTRP
jgi:hypothetical protein